MSWTCPGHLEIWSDIEEDLVVRLPDRIQDSDVLDADDTPPMISEEVYDDDDNDQVHYWNEPGGGDDSIIRMYTDWIRGSEDSEGIIDV
jgi:hypothetical protein